MVPLCVLVLERTLYHPQKTLGHHLLILIGEVGGVKEELCWTCSVQHRLELIEGFAQTVVDCVSHVVEEGEGVDVFVD